MTLAGLQPIITLLSAIFLLHVHIDAFSLSVLPGGSSKKDNEHHNHQHKDTHVHKVGVCEMPHYGEDPDATKKLVNIEEKLVSELTKYVHQKEHTGPNLDSCQKYLLKYLMDYDEDTLAIEKDKMQYGLATKNKTDIVAENPIYTVKVMRRIVKTLNHTVAECKATNIDLEETVLKMFENEGLPPPSDNELERAFSGLLAVTFVYGMNITTNDARLNTSGQLKFEDLMGIANISLEYEEEGVYSYHWLKAAADIVDSKGENAEQQDVVELEHAWKTLMNKTSMNTTDQLHGTLRKKLQKSWRETKYDDEYLCREEIHLAPINQTDAHLYCRLHCKMFSCLKMEVVAENPFIVQYHDFLTEKEIEYIRFKSPTRVIRPETFRKKEEFKTVEDYDTALYIELLDEAYEQNENPTVINLLRKVNRLSSLDTHIAKQSVFELSLHSPLSQYWNVEKNKGTLEAYDPEKEDDSFATLLMFLTDVRLGGRITFPSINVYVVPRKGSVLLFHRYNMIEGKEVSVFHENCPVILGIKEMANLPLFLPFK